MEQAYMGIPVWAWIAAITVVAALVAFALYALRVRWRTARFSQDFAMQSGATDERCRMADLRGFTFSRF